MPSRPRTNPLTSDAARLTPLSIAMTRGFGAADDVGAADVRAAQRPRAGEEGSGVGLLHSPAPLTGRASRGARRSPSGRTLRFPPDRASGAGGARLRPGGP